MKRLLLAALLLAAAPAVAQQANVVNSCGSVAPFGALKAGGQFFPTIDTTGRLCLQGGGGGGGTGGITSIDAGTTPTTGFVANQLMFSDGAKVQPWKPGVPIKLGDPGYPMYMTPFAVSNGVNNFIEFNNSGGVGSGIALYPNSPGGNGIWMSGGSNGGVITPYSFFGFNTGTNSPGGAPDVSFMAFEPGIGGFRRMDAPTSPENLRVYNTFTNFTNGEWGGFDWQTTLNTLTIGTGANGTGAQRPVNIVGNPVTINGAAPGGTITANTTPTGGFAANQAMVSDGTKIQVVKGGTTINLGDASYPVYMTGLNNSVGTNPNLQISGAGTISMYVGPPGVGISMAGGDNPGVYYPSTFFGFNTDTNSPGGGYCDTCFTVIRNSTAGFRNVGVPTTAFDLRVYNTLTNFQNGEWGGFDWKTTPNVLTIGTNANGTGTARAVNLAAPALQINGIVGVSCSGAPTAGFTVTHGIVTAC